MKKVLLTAMALLTIASTSVFGMYGADSDWIDFLVHGNQFRARMQQFGFVLGNDTIRGTFGLNSEGTTLGSIMGTTTVTPDGDATKTKQFYNFIPTVSAGIGYTSEVFSIGVGYNYAYRHNKLRGITKNGYGLSVHTPVVTMTALNNNLRIAIPVQIAAKNGNIAPDPAVAGSGTDKEKYMGISMDPQIRYYTGLETLTQLRLYVKYANNQYTYQDGTKVTGSSVGFDFRAYFGATVGDIALSPFIKVTYDTALDAKGKMGANPYNSNPLSPYGDTYGVKSDSVIGFRNPTTGEVADFDSNPWQLRIMPILGLTANSDIVSIYVEAGLGYKAVNTGRKFDKTGGTTGTDYYGIQHGLTWSSYGEIYITPIKDLEWYFEAEIGNYDLSKIGYNGAAITGSLGGDLNVQFNASTGITWYLPAL